LRRRSRKSLQDSLSRQLLTIIVSGTCPTSSDKPKTTNHISIHDVAVLAPCRPAITARAGRQGSSVGAAAECRCRVTAGHAPRASAKEQDARIASSQIQPPPEPTSKKTHRNPLPTLVYVYAVNNAIRMSLIRCTK
jgi:hypothetical protein